MMKQEFTERAEINYDSLSEQNWDIINMVYAWHPMISDVNGKDEIIALYKKGGMGLMEDMYPTAEKLHDIESEIQTASVTVENLIKQYQEELNTLTKRHNANLAEQKKIVKEAYETRNEIEVKYGK